MRRILLTALLLALPVSSWGAAAFVKQTDSTDTKNVSQVTKSVVVDAVTDGALSACVAVRRANQSTAYEVTSGTFNGNQSFERVRAPQKYTQGDGTIQVEQWYLFDPAAVTGNAVFNFAGANEQAVAVSITQLSGVSAIDSSAAATTAGSGSTTPSVTINTVSDGAIIVDCAMGRSDSGLTVGASGSVQTARTDRLIGNIPAPLVNDGMGVSTFIQPTAGAVVMDWTQPDAFGWATMATSFTPSGGSDPEPEVPSQVTLNVTLGTDPGSPSSGIASTTFTRCTGAGCNATVAPAICTKAFPLTSCVDTGVSAGNTYGYSAYETDGVGLTSTRHATVYVTTSGTPPDAPPTIASAVFDNDGVTITAGAVAPTKVRIWTFTNNNVVSSVEYTWASLTAGRHDEVWLDGLRGGCVSAIDAGGIENTADNAYQCTNFTIQNPLYVQPVDTVPPVLTCPTTVSIPAGITQWTFSCDVNKPNTAARYDTTDAAYATLANTMALNSQTFSATKTGLTDGSTTTLYVRGATVHPFATTGDPGEEVPVVYPNTSSTVVTLTVAAAPGDVTPPGDVATLAGTLLGNAVALTWDAAADAVSYQVYQSTDNVTFAPAGNPVGVTSIQLSLSFGTTYYWKVKALDVVNNLSTNFSNTVTKTTPAAPDIERPSDLGPFTVERFTHTIRLSWPSGTDNSGQVFANIESCQVETGQTDCANFSALSSPQTQTFLTPPNLTPGVRYCFRGHFSDPTGNVSLNYNTPICETTPLTGLSAPRIPVPFGTTRLPLASPRLPNATPRIPVQ